VRLSVRLQSGHLLGVYRLQDAGAQESYKEPLDARGVQRGLDAQEGGVAARFDGEGAAFAIGTFDQHAAGFGLADALGARLVAAADMRGKAEERTGADAALEDVEVGEGRGQEAAVDAVVGAVVGKTVIDNLGRGVKEPFGGEVEL
jgi:hypothetical protein